MATGRTSRSGDGPTASALPGADRLREHMGDYAALLCTDQANARFATGTASLAETVYRDTPYWALVAPGGVRVIAGAADVPEAVELLGRASVEGHGHIALCGDGWLPGVASTGRSVDEAAAAALRALDVDGPVAVDAAIAAGALELLRERTQVDIVLDETPFDAARAIKDDRAVRMLERVNRIVEEAIAEALAEVTEGMTEADLGIAIRRGIVERGAWPTLCVVGFGERGAVPEAWPSARQLRREELIRLDIGAVLEGYHADLARTAVFGTPDGWARSAYDALHAGQDALIDAARPGATAAEVFAAGMSAVAAGGLTGYERHHCGHGIGLSVYETLLVGPRDHTPLRAGMTLCLETPYYELGVGGIQLEDAVVIEDGGARRLGTLDRALLAAGRC